MENIALEVVEMTPTMAEEILANNHENQRALKKARVKKYAEDMITGAWIVNGEPIILAEDGSLIDGQHRLNAVIEANTSVPMIIIKNIPKEQGDIDTFTTINTENRNNADALYIDGFKEEPALFAKYISLYQAFIQRKLLAKNSGMKFRNHEIVDLARATNYAKALEHIAKAKELARKCDLLALNYWILAVPVFENLPRGEEFLEQLADCDLNDSSDPIMAFKRALRNIQGNGGGKFNKKKWVGLFRAYKNWISGKEVTRMQLPHTQDIEYPEGFDYEEE